MGEIPFSTFCKVLKSTEEVCSTTSHDSSKGADSCSELTRCYELGCVLYMKYFI